MDGNVTYFGEWTEQIDKHNRRQVHDYSFEDDVLSKDTFRRLNLKYDREMGFFGKAIAFALQGMVVMQNRTSQGISSFIMYASEQLTEKQKDKFVELYPLLSSFAEVNVVIPKSVCITDEDTIDSVDDYYEMYGIFPSKVR